MAGPHFLLCARYHPWSPRYDASTVSRPLTRRNAFVDLPGVIAPSRCYSPPQDTDRFDDVVLSIASQWDSVETRLFPVEHGKACQAVGQGDGGRAGWNEFTADTAIDRGGPELEHYTDSRRRLTL